VSALSIEFALAFAVFFPVYWGLRAMPRWQNWLMAVGSLAAYGSFNPLFPLMLTVFAALVFALGWAMGRWPSRTRLWTGLGIAFGLGQLVVCKYYEFLRALFAAAGARMGLTLDLPTLGILMPVGISFFTFQGLAYLVDLARGDRARPAKFADTLLYLCFFPTLLAGPICRPAQLLTQIESPDSRTLSTPHLAVWLILMAMFKKLVLANWLASEWVNPLFANPGAFNGVELALGLYCYAIQIYLDFSGYTDLVTGIALLIGFTLPRNFDAPYLALSIKDFWRRWHISLSTWIRDYVYRPLGGNRGGLWATQVNVMIAMLASGLWHGADAKYLLWGGLHGAAVVLQNLAPSPGNSSWARLAGRIVTLNYVCFAWLFFRAESFGAATDYLRAMMHLDTPLTLNPLGPILFLVAFFIVSANMGAIQRRALMLMERAPWLLRTAAIGLAAYVAIQLGPDGIPDFIYFHY
jgi:D-alanyl-lipoteichoic acid acyltransferase DltB (MBOAT superfamily)